MEEIQTFYNKYNISIEYELSNDDFIPIYIYILIKANVPNLVTHCNIIERFLE